MIKSETNITKTLSNIKLNSADKTLLLAFVVFLAALSLHIHLPESTLAEGILFVAEAALVGGAADWFAVTALFEKPLFGLISYHTALLPKRRDTFIKGTVMMVQKEFFSKRNVIRHLEQLHLLPMLMEWLTTAETKRRLVNELIVYIQKFVSADGQATTTTVIATRLREVLMEVPAAVLLKKFSQWFVGGNEPKRLLAIIGSQAKTMAERDETFERIYHLIDGYAKQQVKTPFEQLMADIAEALDFINIEQAARLIQKRLVVIADELTEDSSLTTQINDIIKKDHFWAEHDENLLYMVEAMKREIVAELPIEKIIDGVFSEVREMPPQLTGIVSAEYDGIIDLIYKDESLRRRVERFLYDIAARSALHAQGLIEIVVRKVLVRLTDEELNRLVRDKVEPDLLFIRMNGSIVGAVIGAAIFAAMVAVR